MTTPAAEERNFRGITYSEARRSAAKKLQEAGVPDPETDSGLLLEFASGYDRTHLILKMKEPVPEETLLRYQALLEKRRARIPLQQIVGTCEFMGIGFAVSDKVLTPRQDTETLAELAIAFVKKRQKEQQSPVRVLDLCTGSGCLAVSIRHYCPQTEVSASDISADALKVAGENVRRTGEKVELIESDLFEKISGTFDLIVSNPPYIRSSVIPELMEEVRDHEPLNALDGGEDGLLYYRKTAEEAPGFLRPGGGLFFEIGYDQGREVTGIMKRAGYSDIRLDRDLAGQDRVVSGRFYV